MTGSVTGIDLAAAMVAATAADITRRGVANASVRASGTLNRRSSPTATSTRCWPASSCSFCRTYRRRCVPTHRLLDPAGRLALSTFAEPSDQEIEFVQTCGAAVAPYLPPLPTWDDPPPLQRLRTTESVTGAVQAAGFVDVRSDQRDFEGPVQCWHWLSSGGLRGMLEQVPPDRRDKARAAFIRAVGQLQRTGGQRSYDGPCPVHHCPAPFLNYPARGARGCDPSDGPTSPAVAVAASRSLLVGPGDGGDR